MAERLDERNLLRELARMVRGDLPALELRQMAEGEGYGCVAEMCEARLPEDLRRLRIGAADLLARIDAWRRGRVELRELCAWADELYNVSFNHRITYERHGEDRITSALSALSLIGNEGLFPAGPKTARGVEYVRSCLQRRREIEVSTIFARIFLDLERAHLACKGEPGEALGERAGGGGAGGRELDRWADVVLLDAPYEAGRDVYADYDWMVAFTVTTASLYDEERARDAAGLAVEAAEGPGPRPAPDARDGGASAAEGAATPAAGAALRFPGRIPPPRADEVDRVPLLRRLCPNFSFDRYRPRYLNDQDGIAEIVLDAERIGRDEVRYATRLFCLANRIRVCRLDGEPVKTLVLRPVPRRRETV